MGVSSAFVSNSDYGESSIFKDLDGSIFERDGDIEESNAFDSSSEDNFIYNERFEGNSNLDNGDDSAFEEELFSKDFDENSQLKENINVFNLKSLKSIDDDSDDVNSYDGDDEDYDYDEEDIDENDEERGFAAFSNLWD